jgi:hypothetical protein
MHGHLEREHQFILHSRLRICLCFCLLLTEGEDNADQIISGQSLSEHGPKIIPRMKRSAHLKRLGLALRVICGL